PLRHGSYSNTYLQFWIDCRIRPFSVTSRLSRISSGVSISCSTIFSNFFQDASLIFFHSLLNLLHLLPFINEKFRYFLSVTGQKDIQIIIDLPLIIQCLHKAFLLKRLLPGSVKLFPEPNPRQIVRQNLYGMIFPGFNLAFYRKMIPTLYLFTFSVPGFVLNRLLFLQWDWKIKISDQLFCRLIRRHSK